MVVDGEKTVYHVMSRTALDQFPFKDVDKDQFVKIIKKFTEINFADELGFCIMGNQFHLLVQMIPDTHFTDKEIKKRFEKMYGNEIFFNDKLIPEYRAKWSSISKYVQEIKQTFSRYFNKKYKRRGTLWGERFKSVIVEKGETLVNCLAYIDLNPLRAGLVKRPEEYRWCSLSYHMQTDNKDKFLSFDFGLKEFGVKNKMERIRRYRRYVYEAGAVDLSEKKRSRLINKRILEKERKKDFEVTRIDRFVFKSRYFTDSGIIGSKQFVSYCYNQFKDYFQAKKEKMPQAVAGLDGIFALKRLSEM
jgi:REP element-mobilizing transposase RayT